LRRFLLQMHGTSGAGKTTLAFAIGRETGAVVIDKDILKAGMLDNGVAEEIAGPTAYSIFFDFARSLLAQGFSVVLDSPASFTYIRERGAALAEAASARYRIIECRLGDLNELQRRLDGRVARASQPTQAFIGMDRRPGTSPVTEPRLWVDMSRPVEANVPLAVEYIFRDQD
jgi:predicted kinase